MSLLNQSDTGKLTLLGNALNCKLSSEFGLVLSVLDYWAWR